MPAATETLLPLEKTSPTLTVEKAKIMLYGPPGIGKTTFATQLHELTLLLATEPGYGGLAAYAKDINSWKEFRDVGAELAAGKHPYKVIAVDTADELFRLCQEHVMAENKVKHPSDLEYGKGWSLLTDEWRLRVGKLCSLGYAVIFTSHSKDVEVEQRVGKKTVSQATLRGQAGTFLEGFVDYIFFATHGEDGQRIIHTRPAENWIAKARGEELPDPLPLDAKAVRKAMEGK